MTALLNSRRNFLMRASAMVAATGASAATSTAANAQASDDKRLVCVCLTGGNGGHNTVVPLGHAAYAAAKAARGSLALPDGNTQLLPISTPTGVAYGLNSGLSAISPRWSQGKLAVVANVGRLAQPTSRAQILAGTARLPSNLFSHSHQIVQMQAGDGNGSRGTGWGRTQRRRGGRAQRRIALSGQHLDEWIGAGHRPGQGAGRQPCLAGRGLAQNGPLQGNAGDSLAAVFPPAALGQQLQQVAKIIKLRAAIGMARQVFFCSIGGVDTHAAQSWQQWDLLRQVGGAMAAFYAATQALGVANQVTTFTTFTECEFGRSLQPSGTGSDPGWGSHGLVPGGAVKGGHLYGNFPSHVLAGPDDASHRGLLIPSTALDQYGAALARWIGVDAPGVAQVFLKLGGLASADLGVMACAGSVVYRGRGTGNTSPSATGVGRRVSPAVKAFEGACSEGLAPGKRWRRLAPPAPGASQRGGSVGAAWIQCGSFAIGSTRHGWKPP